METEDTRKYAFGCGVLMLAVLGIIYTMPLWNRPNPSSKQNTEQVQSEKAERPLEPPKPVEVKKKPAQILEELSYMMKLFEDACNKKSLDEAIRLYGQAKEMLAKSKDHDGSDTVQRLREAVSNMKRRIVDMSLERSREVMASGDTAKIDAEIERAWLDGEAPLPEKETLEYLVGRWKAARGAGDTKAADAALRKAADFAVQDIHSITYWKYRSGPLEEAMLKIFTYEELMGLGRKSLADKDPLLAVAYLSAAIRISSSGDSKIKISLEDWLDRQRMLSESLLEMGRLAEEGKLRWLPPDSNFDNKVEILLQMAISYANEAKSRDKSGRPPEIKYAVAIKAWDELFKLYRGKLRRICGTQEPYRVLSYCEDVMFERAGSYISFTSDCFGPGKILEALPDNVKKDLEKKSKDPKQQIFALQEMIRLKAYSPAFEGKEDFVKADVGAKCSLGVALLKSGKFSEAFSYLRPILREYPESEEAALIKKDIAEKIERARSGRDFNMLYGLASFLIGEMKGKSSLPAEFAGKLVESLDAAAEFYKTGFPMKRAFMLSLKADVLGDTEKGREAHAEAMKVGFETVKGMPLKEPAQPSLKLPSLLAGCSVDAIKNSTPYHLMAFYDGPEKFFVRFNPYSNGSLALLDGDYEIAAVVTADDILPYRAKYKYSKEFLLHTYLILEGGKEKKEYSDRFSGKFKMLRVPKGNEGVVLDPDSGFMKP
ncbi:MAG TPA: hypothetical protein DCZ94_21825 [Lentisphaeria bacterium]|nr:MAG: hypothetical protein A2X48_19330 [Lentisphaerae bacterium GWF2_49_21]HBC89586.1 hypothetical protein [Lentisphaeria bacterium]